MPRSGFNTPSVNTDDQMVTHAQNYYDFAKKLMGLTSDPVVMFDFDEQEEKNALKQHTGLFNPDNNSIVIFCKNRHAKDVLRSFAHELIHFKQNLDGVISPEVKQRLLSGADIDDPLVQSVEGAAYRNGSFMLRKFSSMQEGINIAIKHTEKALEGRQRGPQETPKKFVELDELRGTIAPKKATTSAGHIQDEAVEFDHKFQEIFSELFERSGLYLANYYEPGRFYEYVLDGEDGGLSFSIFPCGDDEFDTGRTEPVLQVGYMKGSSKEATDYMFENLYKLYKKLAAVLKQQKKGTK